MRLLVPVMTALVLGACGRGDGINADGFKADGMSPDDFAIVWTDASGNELLDGIGEADGGIVINTMRGPQHCEWQSAVLLLVAVPLGLPTSDPAGIRQYVRDPDGVLPQEPIAEDFDEKSALPEDAEASGFYNGDLELWTAPSTFERFVYVGRGDEFEAWPRADPRIGCD